jgi:hypothetical protein
MRQVLCAVCSCGNPNSQDEELLAQLQTITDPKKKMDLAWYEWGNRVITCERARKLPLYPMDAWGRFVKEYGLKERHKGQHID